MREVKTIPSTLHVPLIGIVTGVSGISGISEVKCEKYQYLSWKRKIIFCAFTNRLTFQLVQEISP